MALSRTDQDELIVPLIAAAMDAAPWDTFLARLLPRSGADRVHLLVREGIGPASMHRRIAAKGWPADDGGELDALGGPPPALRPRRVYALPELLDADNAANREAMTTALATARIGDARLVRAHAPGGAALWLVLLHERPAFGAEQSALLSGLLPAIEAAAAGFDRVARLRMALQAAEETLARLGIGQAVLNRQGRAVTADAVWTANAGPSAPVVSRPFRTEAPSLAEPETVAMLRLPPRELPPSAAGVLAETLGLSAREATLALLLSQGRPLIEAGRELRLTAETTRNYSKRIYAKTGAAGQADLVRIVLTSLAVLA